MRKTLVICCEEGLSKGDKSRLEKAFDKVVKTDVTLAVEVAFVDGEEIRALNLSTRGIDKETDVLSYPTMEDIKGKALKKKEHLLDLDEKGRLLIGSIAVCTDVAKRQAEEYGHSYERELFYLITHGVMHCLGYDHMTDEEKAEMRKKEEESLQKIGVTREEEV
ncbi:MAG: rRNA maturation RNase YbeY [Clostridia bacterium]|nr:rRNA maturation RNase YbeY [Clostridia bacterium]